jgi:peptide/nickel transport system substrate-binding protein
MKAGPRSPEAGQAGPGADEAGASTRDRVDSGRRCLSARSGALVLAVLALALGCRRLTGPRPLVVAFGEGVVALDPHLGNRNVAWSVLSSFCDGLVSFSPNLTIEPALAERWEQTDARLWRFYLRRGVRFHDGTDLTAADVAASIERARTHPNSAVFYYLVGVLAARAEGEHTVVIETAVPVPDLLNRLTFVLVVPRTQAVAGPITAPIGTGPYRFVRKTTDGTVIAKAWNGWRGRPEISDVRFEFCESDDQAARRLLSGAADVCHLVPDGRVSELEATRGVTLVEQPRLAVQLLGIHPELAAGEAGRALADVRVRRALLLGLDRASWVRKVYRGNGTVASQYVHPAIFGFDPGLAPVPYDPAEARRLLAEAGFSGGFEVALAPGTASRELIGEMVRDLRKIGVRVRVATGDGTGPLAYFAWSCSTGDASDFLNSPIWRYHDPRPSPPAPGSAAATTLAVAAAADRELEPGRRLELLQRAQRLVLDEMPLLPLTIRWGFKGVSRRVDVVTRYDERESVASFRWRS